MAAFSTEDLAADPKEDLNTNGGSTLEPRCSPIDQVDTSNVDQPKCPRRTHLNGAAVAVT
jgi:hypothetical protein